MRRPVARGKPVEADPGELRLGGGHHGLQHLDTTPPSSPDIMFTAKTLPIAAGDNDIEAQHDSTATPVDEADQQQQLPEPSTDGVAAADIPLVEC